MSDIMVTAGASTLAQKARGNAAFLRANFDDLTVPEAEVVAVKLNECADRIEDLERQLAERDKEIERMRPVVNSATAEKVLAAAREYAEASADCLSNKVTTKRIHMARVALFDAVREEKEQKK